MDNEKEIPFGAFDSELMHQEIYIPEGFEATIDGDKIILKKIESEDEKVRKTLIRVLNENVGNGIEKYGAKLEDALAWLEKQKPIQNINKEDEEVRQYLVRIMKQRDINVPMVQKSLNWLEKQGKQNTADKIEPKFHESDWVIDKQGIVHQIANVIKNVTYNTYGYDIVGGGYFNDNTEGVRFWTIQDAKSGDVLACENGWTCIFKCLNDNLFSSHCFMDDEGWFCENGGQGHTLDERICGEIQPATKEQCDTLFQKMKEAGYEWDNEKKELKKIEQKPTWSEEDSPYYDDICEMLINLLHSETADVNKGAVQKDLDWLMSLRPQNTWKPSDKQMEILWKYAEQNNYDGFILTSLHQQLKKLRE